MAFRNSANLIQLDSHYTYIARAMKISFEEAVALVESDLDKKLQFIGCPWGFERMEDFKVDGRTLQVQIF